MKANSDCLLVLDSRTLKSYTIPIQDNYILGRDVGQITAPEPNDENANGSGHADQSSDASGNSHARVQSSRQLRVLDNGFENTACMFSSITFVDGPSGVMRYRDIPIEDLVRGNYVYEDVMHLLIWGALPSAKQREEARAVMSQAANPPDSVVNVISAFPRDSDTYPMILAGLTAFAASDPVICANRHRQEPTFHGDLATADAALLRTIAYLSTTIALVYCHKRNKTFHRPEPGHSLIGNLLVMMGFVDPATGSGPDPTVETYMNKLWIVYSDFEITNSTAAALHAGSSLTDPVSCIIAAIISGHGPLHGGAIELAYEAFELIGKPENVAPFIESVKAKKTRLFGYGHRTFKRRDPRPVLIKEIFGDYLMGSDNPLLQIALHVDRAARNDPYFIERDLHVNVDLYGSFPYLVMGFEKDVITEVTILSRIPGVLAHWRESLGQPIRLWRPRQVYVPNAPNQ